MATIIVVSCFVLQRQRHPEFCYHKEFFFSLTLALDCEIHGHRLMGYLDSLSNLLCYVCGPKREFGIRSGELNTTGK